MSELSRRNLMRGAVMLGVGSAGLLTTSTSALGAVPEPTIHGTGAWGARPPSSPVQLTGYRPNKVVIHHTATANTTDYSLSHAYALARSIQNWHMDNNGWIDSGQQFTITRGGHILEGRHRSLETIRVGTQFVLGVHAGSANSSSIGIENEGNYVSATPPSTLINSIVNQVAYICFKYGIPSSQIYGHRDFMSTACPGDVLYRMLPEIRTKVAEKLNSTPPPTFEAIVDNTTAGRFTASANWGVSSYSTQRYGADYRYANPYTVASDAAWYKFNIPTTATYAVDIWYPAVSGYNTSTPVTIVTTSGNQSIRVNQSINGGRWVNLGSFGLAAGDYDVVAVSRWTSTTGYVIADAVRIRR